MTYLHTLIHAAERAIRWSNRRLFSQSPRQVNMSPVWARDWKKAHNRVRSVAQWVGVGLFALGSVGWVGWLIAICLVPFLIFVAILPCIFNYSPLLVHWLAENLFCIALPAKYQRGRCPHCLEDDAPTVLCPNCETPLGALRPSRHGIFRVPCTSCQQAVPVNRSCGANENPRRCRHCHRPITDARVGHGKERVHVVIDLDCEDGAVGHEVVWHRFRPWYLVRMSGSAMDDLRPGVYRTFECADRVTVAVNVEGETEKTRIQTRAELIAETLGTSRSRPTQVELIAYNGPAQTDWVDEFRLEGFRRDVASLTPRVLTREYDSSLSEALSTAVHKEEARQKVAAEHLVFSGVACLALILVAIAIQIYSNSSAEKGYIDNIAQARIDFGDALVPPAQPLANPVESERIRKKIKTDGIDTYQMVHLAPQRTPSPPAVPSSDKSLHNLSAQRPRASHESPEEQAGHRRVETKQPLESLERDRRDTRRQEELRHERDQEAERQMAVNQAERRRIETQQRMDSLERARQAERQQAELRHQRAREAKRQSAANQAERRRIETQQRMEILQRARQAELRHKRTQETKRQRAMNQRELKRLRRKLDSVVASIDRRKKQIAESSIKTGLGAIFNNRKLSSSTVRQAARQAEELIKLKKQQDALREAIREAEGKLEGH